MANKPHDSPSLTLERFAQLLDAYGAAQERWPDSEREAARQLVEQSAAARALRDEAAALDRLLDAVPLEPPSSLLAGQVLATAPRRRPARAWRRGFAAAIPLAAAAALTLWLAIDHEPASRVTEVALERLGEYTSPTDVLLEPSIVDVSNAVPSFGCSDSLLGCPDVDDTTNEAHSQREVVRGGRA